MKLTIFVAALAFAAGVAVRDQAQDYTPEAKACRSDRENGIHSAALLANVLNGGGIRTPDVHVSCRVTQLQKEPA